MRENAAERESFPGGNAREMDARDGRRAPVRTETKIQKEWCPIEPTSGHAFDDRGIC
jgi:hypothetical protein